MTPGMEIRAQTPNGKIGIRAGPGFKRTYFWDSDCEGSVTLWPRVERWHGSLGLYYPGPGNTWWFSCGGVTRAVVEEGLQNFDSVEAILIWVEQREWIQPVYNDQGIAVGWGKVLPRSQLNVEVWQLLINGNKPERLPGSRNDAIAIHSAVVSHHPHHPFLRPGPLHTQLEALGD